MRMGNGRTGLVSVFVSLWLLLSSFPSEAEVCQRKLQPLDGEWHVYRQDEFILQFTVAGEHALQAPTDSEATGVPDVVADTATQLRAMREMLKHLGFQLPLDSRRYQGQGASHILVRFRKMEAAIRSARSAFMKSGYKRLILVLGDMLELGEDEVRYHTELLQVIDDNRPHVLVLCGPLMAHLSQLMAQCKQSFTTATFDTVDAVIEWANVNVRPGDMLMVKSSNGTGLHRLVENILNNSRQ